MPDRTSRALLPDRRSQLRALAARRSVEAAAQAALMKRLGCGGVYVLTTKGTVQRSARRPRRLGRRTGRRHRSPLTTTSIRSRRRFAGEVEKVVKSGRGGVPLGHRRTGRRGALARPAQADPKPLAPRVERVGRRIVRRRSAPPNTGRFLDDTRTYARSVSVLGARCARRLPSPLRGRRSAVRAVRL